MHFAMVRSDAMQTLIRARNRGKKRLSSGEIVAGFHFVTQSINGDRPDVFVCLFVVCLRRQTL
jgi:hypothetical protein